MASMNRRVVASLACLLCAAAALMGCPTDEPKYKVESDQGSRREDMAADMKIVVVEDAAPDLPEDMTQAVSITELMPEQGDLTGGTVITITGSGFDAQTTVSFGESAGVDFELLSETSLKVTTPGGAGPGAVAVTVTNGAGRTVTLPGGFTYLEAQLPELYCQLQGESPVVALPGEASPVIHAQVALDGVTQGDGQGMGLVVELGTGMGTDFSAYTFASMTYARDKDGVMVGDKANDEYEAQVTLATEGTYRYVARVQRPQDGDQWTYCDLDGSNNGTAPNQLGELQVKAPEPAMISYCQLQPQSPLVAKPGMDSGALYALVFAQGLTPGQGQGAGIEGELGYGAMGADVGTYSYVAMSYDGDKDGPNPSDKANDQYGGALNIPAEGTYRYVARFRTTQPAAGQWFYCDLDGHSAVDPFEPEQAGEIQILADPVPMIAFCQTEVAATSAKPGMNTPELTARVFAQGVTDMTGAGQGLSSQLVWGPSNQPPSMWSNVIAATYKEDVDGLVPGDKANDRFRAVIQPANEGDFAYAFRFTLDGGQTYAWCDTDGNTPAGFKMDKLGSLSVRANNLPDACTLQFPNLQTHALKGMPVGVFGRVFEAGVTDVSDGDMAIRAEVVVGPIDADPITEPMRFTSYPATFKGAFTEKPDEDEYEVSFTPMTAGLYQFFYRFSVDGGQNYTRCDLDGATGAADFEPKSVGVLSVVDAAADVIDYCHVFQSGVVDSVANMMDAPIFTMEAYEPGITPSSGGANAAQLEVEFGYGPAGLNPGFPTVYTWTSAPYARVVGNNYEYEVVPYMTAPALGDYSVVARIRRAATQEWTYCDNFNQSTDFLLRHASTLEVAP